MLKLWTRAGKDGDTTKQATALRNKAGHKRDLNTHVLFNESTTRTNTYLLSAIDSKIT